MECHMRAMPSPSVNDEPRFDSDVPVSELTEHDTRVIKESIVSSAPLVLETKDGVTHEIWPTPTDRHGARGLEPPDLKSGDQGTKAAHEGPEAASRQIEIGEKT